MNRKSKFRIGLLFALLVLPTTPVFVQQEPVVTDQSPATADVATVNDASEAEPLVSAAGEAWYRRVSIADNEAGLEFVFPSQSIYLASDGANAD